MNKTLFILVLSTTFSFPLKGIDTQSEDNISQQQPTLIEQSHQEAPLENPTLLMPPPKPHDWSNSSIPNPFDPNFVPEKPEEGDRFFKEFINMLFTLGLILGLLLVASWFVKRFTNSRIQQINEASNIKIIETRALSPKTTIYVLSLMGKVLTLAESSNGVTQLTTQSEERIE